MSPAPDTLDLSTCKRCRRAIRFVYLENGKRVPVDPDPHPETPAPNPGRLVAFLEDGAYVRAWFRAKADWYPFGGVTFTPHSDTCRIEPVRKAPPADIMAQIRADIAAARAKETA